MDAASNFERIIEKNPLLARVLNLVNDSGIRYGLYAGAYVSILTSKRVATDIDFLTADEDYAKIRGIFENGLEKIRGYAVFLYPESNETIEFMARADVDAADSHYRFRLTDLAWENTSVLEGKNFKVRMCSPVDTILLKAMLQRGAGQGKHDLEDIEDLLRAVEPDKEYLKKRLLEVNPDERLCRTLRGYSIL